MEAALIDVECMRKEFIFFSIVLYIYVAQLEKEFSPILCEEKKLG